MTEQRVVVLIPSERDLTDVRYRDEYWPNFVARVRIAIERERLDCRLVIATPPPSAHA